MKNIAVLLTCFNRKQKTINCLNKLDEAKTKTGQNLKITVYLTDDGSSDGTSEAIREQFQDVKILQGDGTLFWAGGMRNSWTEALKESYDAYLLLNDDTNIYTDVFDKIETTNKYCLEKYGLESVYVGTTVDSETKEVSYGGSIITNRFLGTTKRLPLDYEKPIECELGNANIMWVSKNVVDKIGILSEGYVHGMADYDYTLKAIKNKLPALVIPGISGECVNDHGDIYQGFVKKSLSDRIKFLYSPIGLDFKSQLYHMKNHFPVRLPIFFLMGWFKVLFPKVYYNKIYQSRV